MCACVFTFLREYCLSGRDIMQSLCLGLPTCLFLCLSLTDTQIQENNFIRNLYIGGYQFQMHSLCVCVSINNFFLSLFFFFFIVLIFLFSNIFFYCFSYFFSLSFLYLLLFSLCFINLFLYLTIPPDSFSFLLPLSSLIILLF